MLHITQALASAHTLIESGMYGLAWARLDQAREMASVTELRHNHHARSIRGHIAVATDALEAHMIALGWNIQ